ncbi:T9SS type A sorting domain-containing protein [Elizabethkingia sp. JS20170427COW]|uniref:T9SS type A sorting domain-containing protein n=1 Tax=Elizabethkingia sp. JS20170427COW TaxID=2583851 RepID=UPI0011105387|nr:T9SS type A sorting domain-containing protein [Elizabethkingia sp. JS20170427COW]QCX53039.1 hypothetical protein FGE20_04485 [Elizabethkingia sp. JS20170427COW]
MIGIKLYFLSCLSISTVSFAQTELFFHYDEAGNQKYRGTNITQIQQTQTTEIISANIISEEEQKFWSKIELFPVPVKDILTIRWNDSIDGLIEQVSLFQHQTGHWKFQQKNFPDLNKRIQINMSGYHYGVYIIRFQLKDGRVYSKNIIKQ